MTALGLGRVKTRLQLAELIHTAPGRPVWRNVGKFFRHRLQNSALERLRSSRSFLVSASAQFARAIYAASIAAISGLTPMMFITRVRL